MGTLKNDGQKSPTEASTGIVTPGAPAIWNSTIRDLEARVSASDFERYISELKCVAEYKGDIVLAARSRLTADRVGEAHRRLIQRTWNAHDPKSRRLRFIAWDRDNGPFRDFVTNPWADDDAAAAAASATDDKSAREPREAITGERAGFTFETLILGEHNQRAHDLIQHIAQDGDMPARVVVIHGEQGVGKTHLITALQQAIDEAGDDRTTAYCTAEDFQNEYVAGAMARDTRAMKARMRSADIVLIEDLQTIASRTAKGTDGEFCRNLRSITEAGGIVILTTDTAPGQMEGFSARVISQLRGAASVEIGAPDRETRKAIVRRRAYTLKDKAPAFDVTEEMINLICSRVRGQGRELCGALVSLYTEASLGKITPTLEMLERVLDRQAGARTAPSIDLIKRATAQQFDVTKVELEGPRKMQRVVYPRHLAMFLCREMTDKSYPTIARSFGKRDHTSIMYAAERTEHYLATRSDTPLHLEQLRELIYDMQGR